jgi:hypothetical protein
LSHARNSPGTGGPDPEVSERREPQDLVRDVSSVSRATVTPAGSMLTVLG